MRISFACTTVIQEMRGTYEGKMKLKHNRSRRGQNETLPWLMTGSLCLKRKWE